MNAYVVVELKTKAMEYQDCEQLIFYTKLVDKYVREKSNNKTLGILIVREYDSFMIKYATGRDVLAATYKLVES